MKLKNNSFEDLTAARKAKDSTARRVLRVLKAEIERLKSLLLEAIEKLIKELQAQLDALLAAQT